MSPPFESDSERVAGCPAPPCVCPSWAGTKGGSSPLCDETMKERSTTRSQLREGDRPWESRLWESHQAMNKNLLRGRRGRVSRHNTAKPFVSSPQVKGALGWRRFPLLCGEASSACGSPPGPSAACGNARRDRRGVSRGHSSWRNEPECAEHVKIAGGLNPAKGRTNDGTPTRGAVPPRRTRKGK